MKAIARRFAVFLGSRTCYYAIIVFLILQALWIALSAVYPMAFDEDFHIGIIKIYTHHWLPFLSGQPPDANAFGAVARDPSYLYHYLMSFPYRAFLAVTGNQAAVIIILRILNVALFTWGVILFRRLLLRVGVSRALAHTALLIFVLIPIVPQLAGQINYDNLLMPLTAGACLYACTIIEQIRKGRVALREFLLLTVICLTASLVKYPFLPIAAAIAAFLLGLAARQWWGVWPRLRTAVAEGWRGMGVTARVVLVMLVVLTSGLWLQRYGVNTIQYKTPIPACDAVLSVDDCLAYGPWQRDYRLARHKDDSAFHHSPVLYAGQWFYWLWYRLFFAINGPEQGYANYPPLLLPSHTAAVLGLSGLIIVIIYGRRIFRGRPQLALLGLAAGLYAALLWLQNFGMYLHTGQPVAMNGRYLLPILFMLVPIMAYGLHYALRGREYLKPWLAAIVLILFLQGGGVFTFILRSDASWYFHNNAVVKTNNAARRILAPVTIEGGKTYKSRFWY